MCSSLRKKKCIIYIIYIKEHFFLFLKRAQILKLPLVRENHSSVLGFIYLALRINQLSFSPLFHSPSLPPLSLLSSAPPLERRKRKDAIEEQKFDYKSN